jgi:hypothetical protein
MPKRDEPDHARAVGTTLAVRADLDVPGETARQARVFAIWFLCLTLAVVVSTIVGRMSHEASLDPDPSVLAVSRARRFKVAVFLGLLLPALITFGLSRHHRRGGGHARGIVIEVTPEAELRIWGRGYGARVTLTGAVVRERLVDVYAGRLGTWRQRRLLVRGSSTVGAREIELATPATGSDAEGELRVEGGEGNCVELEREDYEALRACILEASSTEA